MTKLLKNFPEYSIMYKNLDKKIQELEIEKLNTHDSSSLDEIQNKIIKYQKELNKIKSLFPKNFFKET